jgi:ATP synthase protein I
MVRPASGGRGPISLLERVGFAMSGDDAGRSGGGAGSDPDGDLSARLRRLETQLDRKRETAPAAGGGSGRSSSDPSALGRAFRMSAEFVAGVIAGGGLGWLLDRGLGTKPWGMIVFLMLGFGAGIANVMRASGFLGSSSGSKPPNH